MKVLVDLAFGDQALSVFLEFSHKEEKGSSGIAFSSYN
jgi:hypothetical protein